MRVEQAGVKLLTHDTGPATMSKDLVVEVHAVNNPENLYSRDFKQRQPARMTAHVLRLLHTIESATGFAHKANSQNRSDVGKLIDIYV
jgi:hypothetical protein